MATGRASAKKIRRILRMLEAGMGRQHWWPAGSAFEVVVGAYLTQNTAWSNVEQAMGNLRNAGVLSISGIRDTAMEELEQLIRPTGYFRQKAARLKLFVAYLDTCYGGSLEAMFDRPTEALREELLGLKGIGQETADSILLYAASREVFVVDTYTRRIFERHGLFKPDTKYEEIRLGVQKALEAEAGAEVEPLRTAPRALFDAPNSQMGCEGKALICNTEKQTNTPPRELDLEQIPQPNPDAASPETWHEDGALIPYAPGLPAPVTHAPTAASQMERSELSQRYNEFHALIVQTAKHYCRKTTPKCKSCPLLPLLPRGGPR